MTALETLVAALAVDSWAQINTNQPIDVAPARTKANFDYTGTLYADDAEVASVMGTSQGQLSAYSGAAIDPDNKRILFTGGGHGNSGDSSLFGFDMEAAAAAINGGGSGAGWTLKRKGGKVAEFSGGSPAYSTTIGASADREAWPNADGQNMPVSCHAYSFTQYAGDGKFDVGGSAAHKIGSTVSIGGVWEYDWDADAYTVFHSDHDPWAALAPTYNYPYTVNGWGCLAFSPFVQDRANGKVYTWAHTPMPFRIAVFRWDRATKDRDGEGNGSVAGNGSAISWATDGGTGTSRNRSSGLQSLLFLPDPSNAAKNIIFQAYSNSRFMVVRDVSQTSTECAIQNYAFLTALPTLNNNSLENVGFCYNATDNVIACLTSDGKIYECTLDADFSQWAWAEIAGSATGDVPVTEHSGSAQANYVYNGVEWLADLGCYVYVSNLKNVFLYKRNATEGGSSAVPLFVNAYRQMRA